MIATKGHLLCSLDWETTGRRPGYHEIIQVAAVPLTNELVPDRRLRPFHTMVRPLFAERADPQAMRTNRIRLEDLENEPEPDKAADLFREWFESLALPQSGRLMPQAHNWPFESAFGMAWLGEHEMGAMFHAHARDSMGLAIHINDICAAQGKKLPFASVSLQNLAKLLGVENPLAHDARHDAPTGAEVYRRLLAVVPGLL